MSLLSDWWKYLVGTIIGMILASCLFLLTDLMKPAIVVDDTTRSVRERVDLIKGFLIKEEQIRSKFEDKKKDLENDFYDRLEESDEEFSSRLNCILDNSSNCTGI